MRLSEILKQKNEVSDLYVESQECESYRLLKVVHLCTQDFGGAGKAAYRLHKGLQTIGVDSTMLVLNKRSGDSSVKVLPTDYTGGTVTSSDVPAYNSPLWMQQLRKWHKLLANYSKRPAGLEMFTDTESDIRFDLVQEIRDADIINLHWVAGAMDYSSASIALGNKPVVWTLHDMNPFTGGCHYAGDCLNYKTSCRECPQLGSDTENDLSNRGWKQKYDVYKALSINVVTPSRWLGKCASESELFSSFPVQVIPNGFPLDTFRPHPKAEIHKALKVPDSVKIILFGADSVLNERKGFRYLLDALNKIPLKTGHDIAILTFGILSKGIKIPSKYSVVNLGSITNEKQLAMAYSAADVYVLPSLEDNLPNTLVEAMACGVPAVCFDIGGIPDVIEHKKTGYLVKPKDIQGLIEGIDWIISSAESGSDFLKECRAKAESKFSLEIQANAYREIYERMKTGDRRQRPEVNHRTSEIRDRKSELQGGRGIGSPQKLYLTALGFMEGGREQEAIGAFKAFLALYPNYAQAHNDLGLLYCQNGAKDEALSHYQKAVKLAPDNSTFQKNLADFYYAILGRIENSLVHYAKALSYNPADIHTLLMLGHISVSKKKFDEAIDFYNKVLKIEPWNTDAREKLDKLYDIKGMKVHRLTAEDSLAKPVTADPRRIEDRVKELGKGVAE
jgi:glycosyltransferase involved in cell wall biosynthesis